MNVAPHGLGPVGRAHSLFPLRLPGRSRPEVRGERVGQSVGDVPDKFVPPFPYYAHGIIHGYFVERVGGVYLVLAIGFFLI